MKILTIFTIFDQLDSTDNDNGNPRELWPLRDRLKFWQLRTCISDNLCDLTIFSDTEQHSQFLQCFCHHYHQNHLPNYQCDVISSFLLLLLLGVCLCILGCYRCIHTPDENMMWRINYNAAEDEGGGEARLQWTRIYSGNDWSCVLRIFYN